MIAVGKVMMVGAVLVMATGVPAKSGGDHRAQAMRSGDSITLAWCPTDTVDQAGLTLRRQCATGISITEVADARRDTAYLGKNIEGKEAKTVYLKKSLSGWIKAHLDTLVFARCATIPETGRYSVSLKIDRLDITESSMYRCSLAVEVTVKGANDTVLERQKVSSDADSWGRSFNEQKYSEASSNSVIQMANSIFALDVFRKPAIKGNP